MVFNALIVVGAVILTAAPAAGRPAEKPAKQAPVLPPEEPEEKPVARPEAPAPASAPAAEPPPAAPAERGALDYLKDALSFSTPPMVKEVADGRMQAMVMEAFLGRFGAHIWAPGVAFKGETPEGAPRSAATKVGIIGTVGSWLVPPPFLPAIFLWPAVLLVLVGVWAVMVPLLVIPYVGWFVYVVALALGWVVAFSSFWILALLSVLFPVTLAVSLVAWIVWDWWLLPKAVAMAHSDGRTGAAVPPAAAADAPAPEGPPPPAATAPAR